jgi:hypothetical protein
MTYFESPSPQAVVARDETAPIMLSVIARRPKADVAIFCSIEIDLQ